MSGTTDTERASLCTCPWGVEDDVHTFACSQRIRLVDAILATARAEAWDEGAEATAEWSASYTHGDNGPPDPPRNPYDVAAESGAA